MIEADSLQAGDRVRHGFFTRENGHSSGIYASLNTGLGSDDDRETVMQNRTVIADRLGVPVARLIAPYQHHSADAVIATEAWPAQHGPRADGVVTSTPGLAISVNTADCTPILFSDPEAGVIGAAHAGWKGAIGGVIKWTVAAMEEIGATRANICAAIGPTISQTAYEVGPEFQQRFVAEDQSFARFFVPSKRDTHFMFDLPGFVELRLQEAEVGTVENLKICTYADEQRFFSYRRTTHRKEPDYGRQLSAIVLTD